MKNKNAPESKRRPHRVADILIWTLCGIWAVLLFGPSGPGTVLARELFSDARAYYLRHFGWKSITVGASVTQGPPEAVMLVSFSDYECPFCFRAEPVLDSLGSLHPEAGVAFRFVCVPRQRSLKGSGHRGPVRGGPVVAATPSRCPVRGRSGFLDDPYFQSS